MKITHSKVPSKEAQLVLDALKSAVMTELEKKRKLGHYIVTWDDITKPGRNRGRTDVNYCFCITIP